MVKPEMLIPVWNTDTVFGETFMMMKDENGVAEAPFLFAPMEILQVTSYNGEITYEEDVDWVVVDGKLRLTENSRIHAFTYDELYPLEKPEEFPSFPMNDRFLLFGEGNFFINKQIAVTYTCARGDWAGIVPQLADKQLPRSFDLLRNGEPMNLLFYGDSITEGANCTSRIGIEGPKTCYGKLLHHMLTQRYGDHIQYINTAKSGMDSNWAVENLEERIIAKEPDLVVLAFGMNDGSKTPEKFEENIRKVVTATREKLPQCEFILVATSLPNPMLTDPKAPFWGNQRFFKERLDAIANDFNGVAVANIRDMHRYLIEHKRFMDLTSNQVNHPNDFFYRMHSHFLAGMLID
jgi:lysophospholipase L1-like esterase